MMKRTLFINYVISGVIAIAIGNFMQTAISQGSVGHGIMCVIAIIGLVLNICCGPDN